MTQGEPLQRQEIVLVADYWYPYNGNPESDRPGMLVEIARTAFERAGITIRYELVPWTRAIEGVRGGSYDGIIGGGRETTPDFVFPDRPVVVVSNRFYVVSGNPWRYDGDGSLEQIRLGVIRDYAYGSLFDQYIRIHRTDPGRIQEVGGDRALILNIRKLLAGRIDVLVSEQRVFNHEVRSVGSDEVIVEAGIGSEAELYLTFSPALAVSDSRARLFSRMMDQLRRDGELDRIRQKYDGEFPGHE